MGNDDYEAVIGLLEEASAVIAEAQQLVGTNKLRTALAWLKRSRKHIRTAQEIIDTNLGDPS